MERSVRRISGAHLFIYGGLVLLAFGLLFGLTGATQYFYSGFLKDILSFEKIRPLHVTSVVFWILFTATGVVYTFLKESSGRSLYAPGLVKWHFLIFAVTVPAMLIAYLSGNFGGREYWEFPPYLAIPVIAGWILFFINVFKSITQPVSRPVYAWMWLTGGAFFLFTFLESYLWLLPFFNDHLVKDMTIQWKSYGSMVGSWNMLIYGSSIYLMDKISDTDKYSRSGIAFSLYFLGLFNLMFNWGHHIYTLPAPKYVQYISYLVSMTELLILGRIIWLWRSSLSEAKKNFHLTSYRFLIAADTWVFLTLLLAICMSVPAINIYTHGTHITVAHTMGATIGINSFLLMAMIFHILHKGNHQPLSKTFNTGYLTLNLSLFVFWIALIGAGVQKAIWAMSEVQVAFGTMMKQSMPWFILFFAGGVGITSGFALVMIELLKKKRVIRKTALTQTPQSAITEDLKNPVGIDSL